MTSPTARSTLPSASCAKGFYQKVQAYPRRSSSTVAHASCVVSSRVTCSMSSVRSAACGGASTAAPASYNRAVVCTRVRTYHSFLRRFLTSQARLRIGWPSFVYDLDRIGATPEGRWSEVREIHQILLTPSPFLSGLWPDACGASFFLSL